jgi:hypothetical protein
MTVLGWPLAASPRRPWRRHAVNVYFPRASRVITGDSARHRPAEFLLDEPMDLSDCESRLRSPQNPKHGGLNRALRWSHRPTASCALISAGRRLALSIEQLSQGDAAVVVRKCPG